MSTKLGQPSKDLPTSSHSHSLTKPGKDRDTRLSWSLSLHIRKPPTQYFNYVPSDNIVDMLLHLENNELATPLPDTPTGIAYCVHTPDIKLNTGIIINLTLDNKQDLLTLQHAKQSKYWNEWLTAMHKELKALKAKDVYKEVKELLHGRKAVQCKWVLHIKWDKDGQISYFKGHLVAKGFTQISR
jgi:hypothetical protein